MGVCFLVWQMLKPDGEQEIQLFQKVLKLVFLLWCQVNSVSTPLFITLLSIRKRENNYVIGLNENSVFKV